MREGLGVKILNSRFPVIISKLFTQKGKKRIQESFDTFRLNLPFAEIKLFTLNSLKRIV